MIKIMSKQFTICLSIFLTLFLCDYVFAFVEGYQQNELLTYSDNVATSGILLKELSYNNDNKLIIKIEKIGGNTYGDISPYYDVDTDAIYLYRYTSTTDMVQFGNGNAIIKGFNCDISQQVSIGGILLCKYSNNTEYVLNSVYVGGFSDNVYNSDGITKDNVDTACGIIDCLSTKPFNLFTIYFKRTGLDSLVGSGFVLNGENYNPPSSTNNPVDFPYEAMPPDPVNGVCGADNGQTTNQEPPVYPNVLCDAGIAGDVYFYDNYWGWFCYGINGGTPSACQAFNTLPIDGVCGADNGGTFTLPDEPENLCSTGYVLDVSFVETTTGWTWACMGYQGGENDYCDATKGSLTLPDLPVLDDCSLQNIPDRWFCEISNSLKSIFLPSASKITELQNVLNQANARFPFNYISRASSRLQSLKNNTNNDTIEISILGNTGDINLDAVEPLSEKTKEFTGGLFVLGFIFWGVGYIKNFF
ncbi:MAG: hypothetical protein M0P51_17320, partial [Methanoculleus sp.]